MFFRAKLCAILDLDRNATDDEVLARAEDFARYVEQHAALARAAVLDHDRIINPKKQDKKAR